MHILVIGGTRFMGPYVIQKLVAAGHEVSLFHRGQTDAPLPTGTRELLGDRDSLPEYAAQLRSLQADVVLDMVALRAQHARDLQAVFAGSARRIVMISSQDVYRAFGRVNGLETDEVDPAPLTEDAPLRTKLYPYRGETPRAADDPQRWRDEYDKIPAEQVIMNHPELPGTILRLPAVYGPHDYQHRLFPYLKRMLDERPVILLEDAVARWRWTHGYVENVADAITLSVTDERAAGRIYNVGEPFALSMSARVEQIAAIVGWRGRIVTLPSARLPESLRMGINAAQDVIADTGRIRAELAYRERIDPAEAFRRTIAWERENPPARIEPEMFDYEAEDRVLASL